MQQVALKDPCLLSVGIALIVLCTKAAEGLVESPVGAQPMLDRSSDLPLANIPRVSGKIASQHAKGLRGIQHFHILLRDHERADLNFTLLAQHGDL